MSDTFKCGHPRSEENTRWIGGCDRCRTCYRAWEKAYRQRTNRAQYERERQQRLQSDQSRESIRLRRLRKLLADHAAAKPHLYPSQQAA